MLHIKSRVKIIIICFLCFLSNTCLYGSNPRYALYVDSNNISFEEVKSKFFSPIDEPSINLGFTENVAWIKFELENCLQTKSRGQLLLVSQNPISDSVIAYIQYKSGVIKTQYFGTAIKHYTTLFQNPMALAINDSIAVIYVKIKSHTFIRDEFSFVNAVDFQQSKMKTHLFLGVILGILFIMLCYNTILYFKLKEIAHIYYAFFIFSIFLLNLYAEGLGNLFVWRDLPNIVLFVEPIAASLGVFGLCFYADRVLHLKEYSSFLSMALQFLGIFSLSLLILMISLDALKTSMISNMLPMLSMVLTFVAAITAWIKGDGHAKYFLLGWSVFMLAAFGRILYNAGATNYSSLIHISQHIGTVIEAFVFTWLISKYIQQEKEKSFKQQLELVAYSKQLDELKTLLKTSIKEETPISTVNINNIDLLYYLKTPLSVREQEVLTELSKGLTYQNISEVLFISKSTVKTHLVNIYEKLDVNNRTEAINKAQNLEIL